jgi:hypothetical protein
MTREEQLKIADNICKMIYAHIEQRINQIPEEWDGIEISQWVTDIAHYNTPDWDKYRSRRRKYNATRKY